MLFFICACLVEHHAVAILKILNEIGVRTKIQAPKIVRNHQYRIMENIHTFHRTATMHPGNLAYAQQQVVITSYDECDLRQKASSTSVSHPHNNSLHLRRLVAKKPAQQPIRSRH